MVTTFQFTYLHLLEATTDKKEVRLQFYLNSNETRYSFCICWLSSQSSLFVPHFLEQVQFFSLQTWKMEFAQDKWSFFGQRKAKAFVKSSVYFADRLMTSKRSRSLFFTAWKTSFRPPTTLEQKRKKKIFLTSFLTTSNFMAMKVKGNCQFMHRKISKPCDWANVWISGFLTSSLEMQR